MRSSRASARLLPFSSLVLATCFALACGPDAHPPAVVAAPVADAGPVASPAPPDLPLPVLRTGDVPPTVAPKLTLVPLRREVSGSSELVALALPPTSEREYTGATVHLSGPGAAFVHAGEEGATLWVHRPAAAKSTPLEGHVYIPFAGDPARAGTDQPFVADTQARLTAPPGKGKGKAVTAAARDLVGSWLEAASDTFARHRDRRFSADSIWRLERLVARDHPRTSIVGVPRGKTPLTAKEAADERRNRAEQARSRSQSELDERVGVLSGATGMAAAAALGEGDGYVGGVGLAAADRKRVPFDDVTSLTLTPIPWSQLTPVGPPPPEPLAAVVPAEFYYVRATDVPSLQAVLGTVETWANAADRILDGSLGDDQIVTRYETALGVQRGVLVRLLGTTAVGQVALTGSDLYLAEGSDLTVILEVRSQPLVDAALAGALAVRAKDHGEVRETTREHAGVAVHEARTGDSAVRRQRADVGGRTFLSTSAVAMDRVLDTLAGQHPRLADEPDFQHLLARDPLAHVAAITFAGDRFFAEVTSPRQRILESRRRIARDELVAFGESALLYGWLFGQEPATTADIVRAGLLVPAETRHSSGEAVTFVPGSAPHSTWGTPGELRPLLEMPTPATVTRAEFEAYQRFATSYRTLWNEHLDPLLVRFTVEGETTTVDVRQMPIPWTSEYRDLSTVAGDVHLEVPPLGKGLRFTTAIGKNSELRRVASDLASGLDENLKNALDWIGDSATVGTLDDHHLAQIARFADSRWSNLQAPPSADEKAAQGAPGSRADDEEVVYQLPVYATIDVGNPITAGLLVATLRKEVEGELKDDIVWREVGKEGDATIIGVQVKADRGWFSRARLFYSFAGGALVLALREDVVRAIIRERASGHEAGARAVDSRKDGGTQHVLELAHDRSGGLATVLLWLAETGALEADDGDARALADFIYRGAPSVDADPAAFARLASAYLGGVPRPVDGGVFSFGPDGAKDPWRGTASHPAWPALPVPHAEATRAVTDLARLRAELSFDPEGKSPLPPRPGRAANPALPTAPRSLHARLTFTAFNPESETPPTR